MNQVAEIKTNQNVVLRTELASIGSRVIGAVMDTFFLLIAYLIIIFLVNLFFDDDEFLIIGFLTLPLMFFTPICEQLFNGKTPAKMILGTKVIQINGETPTLEQSMARWFFRIFEIALSLGSIGFLAASSSPMSQRFGDRSAGTIVITEKKASKIQLEALVAKFEKAYTPIYNPAPYFSDDDILTLKIAINRFRTAKNDRNKQFVKRCYLKVLEKMGMEKEDVQEKSTLKFLTQIIRDYVYLTK